MGTKSKHWQRTRPRIIEVLIEHVSLYRSDCVTQVDSLAVNLHDAVVLYALGLNKSITQGTEDCKVVKNDMVNLTFNGSCFLGNLL